LLFIGESEEASSRNKYSEEKTDEECSANFSPLFHKIPSLLIETLNELIDCSDDMVQAFSSITIQNRKENVKEEINVDNANHIFLIPQLRNTNESIKKYTDFITIGRRVLAMIKLH
jgi:hypothetical protein